MVGRIVPANAGTGLHCNTDETPFMGKHEYRPRTTLALINVLLVYDKHESFRSVQTY